MYMQFCYVINSTDFYNQVDGIWQVFLDKIGVPPRPPTSYPPYRHDPELDPAIVRFVDEVPEQAAALRQEANEKKYVGFDLEYAQGPDQQIQIACLQFSTSDTRNVVFKFVGEDLTVGDVLGNPDIRHILESLEIAKVGVGIQGTSINETWSLSSADCIDR